MSTWRMQDEEEIEEVEEVKEVKEVEDSVAGESCLARKLASFGIAATSYYTPRRI
jgi:hypothetical protein